MVYHLTTLNIVLLLLLAAVILAASRLARPCGGDKGSPGSCERRD